jgi:hypothetical protein
MVIILVQPSKKFLTFYKLGGSSPSSQKTCHDPLQKQINPVLILAPHFSKIYFNITLSSKVWSPTDLSPSGFLTKISYISHLFHAA